MEIFRFGKQVVPVFIRISRVDPDQIEAVHFISNLVLICLNMDDVFNFNFSQF